MVQRILAMWILVVGTGVALIDCGGGSTVPVIAPGPAPTGLPTSLSSDDPVNPLITPAPGPTGIVPVPPTPYPSAPIVVGVQPPASELQESGTSLFGFINPTAKSATLAVSSSTYVDNSKFPATATALPGGTFAMQTNGALAPFNFGRGTAVIDLNATRGRVKNARSLTQGPLDPALDVPQTHLRVVASRLRSLQAQIQPTAPPAPGTQQTWNVSFSTPAGGWATIQATMLATATVNGAAKGYVWLDNALIAELGGIVPATTLAQTYASSYAAAVAVEGKFGVAPAGTNMTPLDWLANAPSMSKVVNTCDASGTQTGTDFEFIADPGYVNVVVPAKLFSVLGYVWSIDLSPQTVLNCFRPSSVYNSNQTSAIYVTYTGTSAKNLYQWKTTVTHELEHQASFAGRLISNAYPAQESWVEEGMGTLAQDYVAADGRFDVEDTGPELVSFLSAPQNFSLTGFAALLPNDSGALTFQSRTAKSYALSYLFLKYLADRFGDGIVLKIQRDAASGTAGIADATGLSFNQLVADFTTMLAVSNTGIVPAGSPNYAKYNMQSFSLGSAYTPQFADPFTLPHPATLGALTPNAALSVQNMYYSGFAFFSFGSFIPTGSTIKLTDRQSGELGLTGGIGQQ